ncbi:MAG: helix-turn-helix domain-containing protein [Faecousia sp.]
MKIVRIEDAPLVLKVKDLPPLLKVGRNTAYELVRSGKIHSVKVGRVYRIPRDAVIDYLLKSS